MTTNSEKIALIQRVLNAPFTFDTDDAVSAIHDVLEGLDPFDQSDPVDDDEADDEREWWTEADQRLVDYGRYYGE